LADWGGYSARNFLEATGQNGQIYSIDLNPVPKLATNHFTIQKDINTIEEFDVHSAPLDLVFFDCHYYEGQMNAFWRLSHAGIITDRTVIALHDTNLFPSEIFPSKEVEGGWRHIHEEAMMVNEFKKWGYDIFCFHTDMRVHSDPAENLPYRWGLTIASRFKPLALTPITRRS